MTAVAVALFVLLAQSPEEMRLPLRVLYASDPGTEYSAGWVEFLTAHTKEVRAVGHAELTPELARSFDVLVIDGELQQGGEYKKEQVKIPLRLSELQGQPVVLMGGVAGNVSTDMRLAGSWGLWGCHCLAPWLVVPSAAERHVVFRTPFAIDEPPVAVPTPKKYLEREPDLGPQLDALRVFATNPDDPGYVTRGDFRALPDAEWIASGLNSKSGEHAALLRHGSFVLWGFHGPAKELTGAGTKIYLNSLAYAHAHQGKLVENLRLASPREELLAFYMRLAPARPRAERPDLAWFFPPGFPESVLDDPSTAPAWFAQVRGQVRPAGDCFTLDPRCAELGPANDSPAFLDALEKRLGATPDDALALELLARYVPAAPREGASAWLRAHRNELDFTDVGGFVWKLRGERADTLRPLQVAGVSPGSPVRVEAAANEEMLVLEIDVRAGWHLYARPDGKLEPLALQSPTACRYEIGELALPADKEGHLTRHFTLRVPLKRRFTGEGHVYELSFQACDADSCRPPETVRLER